MIKNPDIWDIVNTIQKMAQKRAYIAAVLLAVNGSDYFEVDDSEIIEGELINDDLKDTEIIDKNVDGSLVEAAKNLGGKVVFSMSLESAESVKTKTGIKYGELDNESLSSMIPEIEKWLKKENLDQKTINEFQMKLDAIRIILNNRTNE